MNLLAEIFDDSVEQKFDENFFRFRTILRRTHSDAVIEPDDDHVPIIHVKTKTQLFDVLDNDDISLFEKILQSRGEKGPKYISLIWDEFEFWRKKKVLSWTGKGKLPIELVVESENYQSFYSFLIFDWHNPDQHMTNSSKKYYLELKNRQLIELFDKSLFQKLYEIVDSEKAHTVVCLRIIYEYLHEMEERIKKEEEALPDDSISKDHNDDLCKLVSLENVDKMKNKEMKKLILSILLTYWNILDVSIVEFCRDFCKSNVVENLSGINFFTLALQLIDRQHNKFEEDFDKFIIDTKRKSGHYYETDFKPVARLFLKIAKTQRMSRVRAHIFNKCPFLEINSSPLTNFEEFYKFNNKNIFPFENKEKALFVSLTKSQNSS